MRPSSPPLRPASPPPPRLEPRAHPCLTKEQSREIPLGNEGVLAMTETELDEVDDDADSASDRTRTGDGPGDGKGAGKVGSGAGAGAGAGDLEKHAGDTTEEEWTYPDGGLKAWSVVLVSALV